MEGDEQNNSWLERNRAAIVVMGVFVVLTVVIIMIFFAIRMVSDSTKKRAAETVPAVATTTAEQPAKAPVAGGLPVGGEAGEAGSANGRSGDGAEAEKFDFGDFYKDPADDFAPAAKDLPLPLNVKVDVSNYHDVYRKINLDSALADLNENGFAVIANPFPAEADNFYAAYDLLDKKQVPSVVTGDFLVYYYQNTLKTAYKEIESSVFFENLWLVSKDLYVKSKNRYEKIREQKGLAANDLALEGARLETAFFATTLMLLSPVPEQVEKEGGLSSSAKFTPTEAEEFSFTLPDYLKDDVAQEVALIRAAKEKTKSPVLLYESDYRKFALPANYKANARLSNFYLAQGWVNSVFPLYYKSAGCQDCLLDKDDWRINMYAALLLAEDFSENQELQNRWAKIYKIKSFFSGLRRDLNYLYYQKAFADLFGADKRVEDVFASGTAIDENLGRLQERLAAVDFPSIEGGLDKSGTTTKPVLGLKMLVDAYWPNDYLLGELTYPKVGAYQGASKEKAPATACDAKKDGKLYRCYGLGLDVINLIAPVSQELNGYFATNTKYERYSEQVDKLKKELQGFTAASIHNNNYWSTLDFVKKSLAIPESYKSSSQRTAAWKKKDLNTGISAWVNLQLPADIFAPRQELAGGSRLNEFDQENPYALFKYVEPNLVLARELAANAGMVIEMLELLNAGNGQNTAIDDLKDMKKNLDSVEAIIKKELKSEDLSEDDYKFINDFTRQFSVKEKGSKVFKPVASDIGAAMAETLDNVKFLIVAYQRGEKKLFVVGPVFNYWEEKK